VGSFQALRHRIADVVTEIECTCLLVRQVALDMNGVGVMPPSQWPLG
jgi:alkylation response protein AidB-like acyl-CoA dehydrogenase